MDIFKNLKELERYLREDPDLHEGPSEIAFIRSQEKELGLVFSTEYVEFLQKFSSALLEGYFIYGIKPIDLMGSTLNTVVSATQHYRKKGWPFLEKLYVISDDGQGNPIGVDPEGNVWLIDHDSGFEKVLLAKSFNEFLVKAHTDTLFDVDEG